MTILMNSSMLTSVAFALTALLLLNGLMYLRQPAMTFFPHTAIDATPETWGFPYNDVYLTSNDGVRLHAWFIPHANTAKTVLFFHGNGGNISHRGESIAIFHRLGLNVFILDYRGYGQSAGVASEEGLYLDAQAAWDYLVQEKAIAPEDILVFGRSLGGVVAADLAANNTPGALILESTFSSASDMAVELFPLLSKLVWLRYEFDTLSKLQKIACAVLVLHSPDDEIVPLALGEKVFAAARKPKQFYQLSGGHNDGFLRTQPYYAQQLGAFIEQHL